MENKKLSSGIITVLIANVCNLGFSVLTSFLLPKYLSVETYAAIKTYQLYIGYIGLLHLGYVDGIYIKNGGRRFDEISRVELSKSLATLRVLQMLIMSVFLGICVFYRDTTFIAFTLAILPINMAAYFQMLFQSIGEFKRYSVLIRATTIATFIVNMVLLLLFRTDLKIYYLSAYVILSYIIWFVLEQNVRSLYKEKFELFAFDKNEIVVNVKSGLLLTLGNLSSSLFTGMDRWFVKILMTTFDFAQYSFAVSIEHFVNVALNPVSITLYNYFCRHDESKQIIKIRRYVLIFATIVIAAAFPAKFIMEHFLTAYIEASRIIFLLFSAQIFYFTIKSIYVNLYKARKKQNIYFMKLIVSIAAGAIFNMVFYYLMRCREAFAVGTVFSSIFWWVLCLPDFKEIKYRLNEILYMFIELIAYNFCGIGFNSIIGFCIYVPFTVIMMLVFLRYDVMMLFGIGKTMLISKFRRIR